MNTVIGLILVLAGCATIIFRKSFVKDSIDFQNKRFGFHFGKSEIKAGQRVAPFLGIALIIMGFLYLLGIVDPR
jgi:hypothetical protein